MKTLNLNEYGVTELSKTETINFDGGWVYTVLRWLLHANTAHAPTLDGSDGLYEPPPDGYPYGEGLLYDNLDNGVAPNQC